MEQFVTAANSIMWSLPMVVGLLALGLYFTIRMAAPQVRLLTDMVGQLARGGSSSAGISSFQAFAMALGGRIGVGNIGQSHLDSEAGLQVGHQREGAVVAMPGDDDGPILRQQRHGRGHSSHPRGEDQPGQRGGFQLGQGLFQGVPGRVGKTSVRSFPLPRSAGAHEGGREHDRWIHGGIGLARGSSGGNDDGIRGKILRV